MINITVTDECLFVWSFSSSREFSTHLEASPLPVNISEHYILVTYMYMVLFILVSEKMRDVD